MENQSSVSKAPDFDVAVLGAGFSGLGAAVHLKRENKRSFVVLEKAADVGGTWRENQYPGCACDVPSHLYSFSFAQKADWTRLYPTQPEIEAYLRECADKFALRPHIRFGQEITGLAFDEDQNLWRIETKSEEPITARVVISGMGGLHIPQFPKIPGADSFAGPAFHTSQWRPDVSLAGKRIAVIGTGASAIQVVPQIARQAGKLFVFQRTPPWVMPKMDRAITDKEQKLFSALPAALDFFRLRTYALNESRALAFTKVRPKLLAQTEALAKRFIDYQIQDPTLRAKVTPNFRVGCKRVLIANDYYPALARENVDLITDQISEIRPNAIVTADGGVHEIDVLIYATGFQPMVAPTNIIGLGGRTLGADWAHGPEAHLGITVSGYPNLFLLMGPNTGLGHNSMIFMIESQIRYVMQSLKLMDRRGAKRMSVKRAAQDAYNAKLQRKMSETIWASGCKSWYVNDEGKNATLWPGFTFDYRWRTRAPKRDAYELS